MVHNSTRTNIFSYPMQDFQDVYIDRIDLKAAFTGSIPGDPPLLTELGINFSTILQELKLIFNPTATFKATDLTGPFIFIGLYAFALLFKGKIHFGYVYMITILSCILLYFILNVTKETDREIDVARCFSVFGYAFAPIVGYAYLSCFYEMKLVGYFCFAWSVTVATTVFCKYLEMEGKFGIVGYPLCMIYLCYLYMIFY